MTDMSGFWVILTAGTVFLVFFTWISSIREKRFHGYPRFVAFEGIFILVLLNRNAWFLDPWSFRQLVSWALLLVSLAAVIAGFTALRRYGKPDGRFENTTRLVNRGIYGLIRHPMYASLLFFGAGAFLKGIGLAQAVVLGFTIAVTWLTALMDEKEMKARFGAEYTDYMSKTRRFIPFLI